MDSTIPKHCPGCRFQKCLKYETFRFIHLIRAIAKKSDDLYVLCYSDCHKFTQGRNATVPGPDGGAKAREVGFYFILVRLRAKISSIFKS